MTGCTPVVRDLDDARQVIAATCFPPGPSTRQASTGQVGLELETFPMEVLAGFYPAHDAFDSGPSQFVDGKFEITHQVFQI